MGIYNKVSDSINAVTWILLAVFFGIGTLALIIEITKIGDIPNLNYKELEPKAKFSKLT
jgi:hypothetical protein